MTQSEHKKPHNLFLPVTTENYPSLQVFISSGKFLAAWAQRELSPLLSDVVVHFLLSLQSVHTKRSYFSDINDFLIFTKNYGLKIEYITQINEKILILWHDSLIEKETLSQISIRHKLLSISSLLEFCKKRKLLEINPMKFLKMPKVKDVSRTNAFTIDEVKQILLFLQTEIQKCLQTKNNLRQYKSNLLSYTVILTLFSVGMRVNELCELKIKDVEFASDFTRLHMKAKGNREHAPIIHKKTAQTLKEYIEKLRAHAGDCDYLFVRVQSVKKETKLSQTAVYNIVTQVAKKMGLEKKVSPHSCRATLATILHKQGVPIGHIQNLLNHKDITTTAVYIKKADEFDEAAAAKLNLNKK